MEYDPFNKKGVGEKAEAMLEPLSPLIEYYAREMGELPGRLMIAINFLGDARQLPGYEQQSPELKEAIEKAQALAVSVMIRLMNLQESTTCGCDDKQKDELQAYLDSLPHYQG